MRDRIKQIRKEAHVNQFEFADSLGLSRSLISQVESGVASFSDRSIRDICRVYHINEEWLRTGSGDPHPPRPRNQQIAEFMNTAMECDDQDFKNQVVFGLSQLDLDDWEDLARIFKKFAQSKKEP